MSGIAKVGAIGIPSDSNRKEPDNLILVDAYWIKDGMKIRILPQQKRVDLVVEFVYQYDDDRHDKNRATMDLKFEVPGTFYDNATTVTVSSKKLTKWDPVRTCQKEEYKDKELYYLVLKDFVSDLTPLHHREMIDEIILLDAYWEKEGMKIRFIPHQKEVELIVVLAFKHDDNRFNKEKAKFHLKFSIPDTFYAQYDDILIYGSDLLNFSGEDVIKDEQGRTCYLYRIKKFSSDLTTAELPKI
mgnify:FL=1